MPAPPSKEDVLTYLGTVPWAPDQVEDAYNAEVAAQVNVIEFGDPEPTDYPADLAEALKRRVARNLALRNLPLGTQTSATDAGVAVARIGDDREIARLEGPYLRLGI